MINSARVVVLAEDSHQEQFARHYIKRLFRYDDRQIRSLALPAGRGSGEQWVRKNYAPEVRVHRGRAAKTNVALIVLIDADDGTVADHQTELRKELAAAALDPRGGTERIVHLIPKWCIETWILCLTGTAVDEEKSHRHEKNIEPRIVPAAQTLFDWSRPNTTTPAHCIHSITAALPEIRRLE